MSRSPIIWLYWLLYIVVAFILIAYPLLPLQFTPDRYVAPGLFFALTMAWVVRQPVSAPFILVAALAILADSVSMRPLGLWAAMVIISSEIVRFNHKSIQDRGLLAEFSLVASLLVTMVVVQNIVLWISFSQSLSFVELLQFVTLTLAVYPLIVAFLHYILRVRKPNRANRPDRLGKII